MIYPANVWIEKKKAGLPTFLLWDGVIKAGGPFAVVMQVVGYFLFAEPGVSYGTYFTLGRTWLTFLLHGILFGTIVGYLNWWRNEKVHGAQRPDEEDK